MRRLLPLIAAFVLMSSALAVPAYANDPLPGTNGYPSGATGGPGVAAPQAAGSSAPLQSFQSFAIHGGYVAAGVGMRNRGFGTVSIAGIPDGSSVKAAYLFWDILGNAADPRYAEGQINGQPIVGVLIASGGNPCWGNSANFAYRADVTNVVSGNGSYLLTAFASNITDGRDPWNAYDNTPPLAEGASLVVVYENAALPQAQIVMYDGATKDNPNTLSQTLVGFTAPPHPTATTTFIGADGQDTPEQDSTFNGVAVPSADFNGSDPQAGPPFSHGNL